MAWYDENLEPIPLEEAPLWAETDRLAVQAPDEQRMDSAEASVAVDGDHGNGPGGGGVGGGEADRVPVGPFPYAPYAPCMQAPRVAAPSLLDMLWSELRLLTRWVGMLWCEACVWLRACEASGICGLVPGPRRERSEY